MKSFVALSLVVLGCTSQLDSNKDKTPGDASKSESKESSSGSDSSDSGAANTSGGSDHTQSDSGSDNGEGTNASSTGQGGDQVQQTPSDASTAQSGDGKGCEGADCETASASGCDQEPCADGASPAGSQDGGNSGQGEESTGAQLPIVVAVGLNHSRFLSLDDGQSWCLVGRDSSRMDYDNPFLFRHVNYVEGKFVTASSVAVMVSSNGWEWEDTTGDDMIIFGGWAAEVTFGNGWWVGTGGYGSGMRSRDLREWEDISSELPGPDACRSLAFGNGIFMTGRDTEGWWSSVDGTAWTQVDPAGPNELVFDGSDFVANPGYVEDRGVRLMAEWPNVIKRSTGPNWEDYTVVLETDEFIEPIDIAFGFAPESDLTRARVEAGAGAELADCLGL